MNSSLEKACCLRLIHEFEQICFSRSLSLTCPNFEISQTVHQVGQWNNVTKTIRLSSQLIKQHSWDVVIEVLKHEMAHQYVIEFLADSDSTPHGSAFQEACSVIGVHPLFRNSSGKLPKILKPDHTDSLQKNKYIKRIEKLFALAQSATEHEASLAMEKANQLISKYTIEIAPSATESSYDYVQLKIGNKRVHSWTKSIIAIIRDFFYVKAIYLNQYNQEKDQEFKAVEFLGRPENLAIAKHVFFFLHERLDIFWQQYSANNRVSGKDKRSYFLGVLFGFREKLDESDKKNGNSLSENSETTSALVLSQDHGLNAFFKERYPKTRNRSTGSMSVGADAFNSGITQGRKLNIYKTIEKNIKYTGLRLTEKP